MTDDNIILNSEMKFVYDYLAIALLQYQNAEQIYAGSISKSVDEDRTTISGINAE